MSFISEDINNADEKRLPAFGYVLCIFVAVFCLSNVALLLAGTSEDPRPLAKTAPKPNQPPASEQQKDLIVPHVSNHKKNQENYFINRFTVVGGTNRSKANSKKSGRLVSCVYWMASMIALMTAIGIVTEIIECGPFWSFLDRLQKTPFVQGLYSLASSKLFTRAKQVFRDLNRHSIVRAVQSGSVSLQKSIYTDNALFTPA